jgi:hypothetical protein
MNVESVVESSLVQNIWLVICGRWNPEGRPGGRKNVQVCKKDIQDIKTPSLNGI